MRWINGDGPVRYLQTIIRPITSVLDNPSQYAHWQVRISREDLESRVNQYYPVGTLIDVLPQKRGTSKRVIDSASSDRKAR